MDLTALLGPRTGVGTIVAETAPLLARDPDLELIGYAASWRGRGDLRAQAPAAMRLVRRPMAAQPLRRAWQRMDAPPIEWWTGPIALVHGTNYVVPPSRRAVRLASVYDLTMLRYPQMCTADVLQYPALLRRALAGGAHLHTISAAMRAEVIDLLGAPAERVHLVPSGVSPVQGGDAARGHQLAGSGRYVLALGTVEPRKGLPMLVRAFDAVATTDAEVRLVVAGPDGWGVEEFLAAVNTAHHRDRIVRLGWVDAEARADLIRGATAFAYPSVYEGFGLPPLEAMSAGLPVVASDAGALVEVLGDAALLVPVGDESALAAALQRVCTDEVLRSELIRRGTERCTRYSWAAMANGLSALYKAIC